MANILAVGIATIDVINTTDGFPREDDEVRATSQEIRRGGNATNTLVVLSLLGHQCHWMGSLADDANSQIIVNDLNAHGINHSACEIHSGSVSPTSYITLNSKNGSRTIVHYRDLPEMSADTFKRIDPANYDWIHFEGRNVSQTTTMISSLKTTSNAVPVSIEIEKQRDNLDELFTGGDIYFFSKAFAESINFSSAESLLLRYRDLIPEALLVCTWGSDGAYAMEDRQLYFGEATRLSHVVDTVGAGDTFNAAFIHATLASESLQSRLNFACEIAAKKCMTRGFSFPV